jgi:hypothetical protein
MRKRTGPVWPAAGQHPQRPPCDRRRCCGSELLAVAADQLPGQRAAALGPERHVRRIGQEAVAAARRAGLGAMDLKLGGVQIDRRLLAAIAAKRPVKPAAHAGQRPLDRLDVTPAEATGQLAGGRRRRHPHRGAQPRAGAVATQLLDVVKALAADQLGLGQRDDQLTARHAPAADLHRRGPTLGRKLAVDQLHQPQPLGDLAGDRQPGVGRDALIVGAKLNPSGPPETVPAGHLQGDFHPRSSRLRIPRRSRPSRTENPATSGVF